MGGAGRGGGGADGSVHRGAGGRGGSGDGLGWGGGMTTGWPGRGWGESRQGGRVASQATAPAPGLPDQAWLVDFFTTLHSAAKSFGVCVKIAAIIGPISYCGGGAQALPACAGIVAPVRQLVVWPRAHWSEACLPTRRWGERKCRPRKDPPAGGWGGTGGPSISAAVPVAATGFATAAVLAATARLVASVAAVAAVSSDWRGCHLDLRYGHSMPLTSAASVAGRGGGRIGSE